ncbi:hypothetical protein PC116_g33858, partial [Phytophthora cactorum]
MEVFLADSEDAETLPRERVLRYLGAIDANLEIRYLQHIITELEDGTPDFHNRLVELLVQALKEGERDEAWSKQLKSLVAFLKSSQQYSLSKALSIIPRDDPAFYEARAIVFSNMGSHKQALEIYVFNMQDYVKAEE